MSRTRATVVLLATLTAALAWAPSAGAAERLLTLYSPQLTSQPRWSSSPTGARRRRSPAS